MDFTNRIIDRLHRPLKYCTEIVELMTNIKDDSVTCKTGATKKTNTHFVCCQIKCRQFSCQIVRACKCKIHGIVSRPSQFTRGKMYTRDDNIQISNENNGKSALSFVRIQNFVYINISIAIICVSICV